MTLIKCKECGKEISKDAEACPHCGKKQNEIVSAIQALASIIKSLVFLYFIYLMYSWVSSLN